MKVPTLEEIRKSLIKDQESFAENELVELGEKINQICVLDTEGDINFKKNLGDKEKIKFALIARFIARKIEDFFKDKEDDKRIKPYMTNEELEKMLKSSKAQVRARLSDLRKENFVDSLEGKHQIKPLLIHKILQNG